MKNLQKAALCTVGGILAVWLTAGILLPVGLPFLLGWLLSALAAPATKRIAKHIKLPYWLISFVCLTLLAGVIVLLIWLLGQLLINQLAQWGGQLPELLQSLEQPLALVRDKMLLFAQNLPVGLAEAVSAWVERLFDGSSVLVSSASQWLISLAAKLIAGIPDLFLFLLTMILSAYLFAAQAPSIREFLKKHIPLSWQQKLCTVRKRLKTALSGYFKAQLRLSVVTFGLVFVGLLMLKREYAFVLALLIALIDALPVFGAGTVLIPWSIVLLLSGSSATGLGMLALYAVCALCRTALEPRFLGKQIGLSPLLTLIALYAGYRLFGILGMVLFPIGAILTKQIYDLTKGV